MNDIRHPTDDVVMATLKRRFFDVAAREDYPNTPALTLVADRLQEAIQELQRRSRTVTINQGHA